MDKQVQIKPDYSQIYADIIEKKCPHKYKEVRDLLKKEDLSTWDIIEINDQIFGENVLKRVNPKHRSYTKSDILKVLKFQRQYRLNNTEVANHFGLSRNTVAKWRKLFNR